MHSNFPMDRYLAVMEQAQGIVKDRCSKGRNDFLPFEKRYIHGPGDKVQEVLERALRIVGAYQRGEWDSLRGDALDLANESALLVVLLDLKKE